MTEKQRRAQMANELSEITHRLMRDAGALCRAMCDLSESEKTMAQVCHPLKRYGGEHGQAYGAEVLAVVEKFAPAKTPKPKRAPLPDNVTPLFH